MTMRRTTYNEFCILAVGGYKNAREIKYCEDTNCPFHPFRWGDITLEDKIEMRKKLEGIHE